MSPKNTLQEFFQKSHLPLPKYETLRLGGNDHQPLWQSRVALHGFPIVVGGFETSKTKAENSAAARAIDVVIPKKDTTVKHKLTGKIGLFVDVENMPKFIDTVLENVTGLDIYAVVGQHHSLSEKDYQPEVTKILSPSTRTDGSDTCMQVYIGYLLSQNKYDQYLIATRDHYGSALVDMITSNNLLWKKKDAKVVTTLKHILE